MPTKKKAERATVVFGRDWVPLSSRAGDDETSGEGSGKCLCLACSGDLVEILPLFAVEVVKRYIKTLRYIIDPLNELLSNESNPDFTEDELAAVVHRFEKAVGVANLVCDAVTPWVVWKTQPKQRATRKKPVALEQILEVTLFLEYLNASLATGDDYDSGGELWRLARGITEECHKLIVSLQTALRHDSRVTLALSGSADDYYPKLRLTRVDPPEEWHFCSEECCRKFEQSLELEEQNGSEIPQKPRFDMFTKTQRRVIDAVWELADWAAKPHPIAVAEKVAEQVWGDEEKVSTALRPALSQITTRALEARINFTLRMASPYVVIEFSQL